MSTRDKGEKVEDTELTNYCGQRQEIETQHQPDAQQFRNTMTQSQDTIQRRRHKDKEKYTETQRHETQRNRDMGSKTHAET